MSDSVLRLAALPGDGIGPEIVEAATAVLTVAAAVHGVRLEFDSFEIGLAGIEAEGETISARVLDRLREFRGILLGPVGHADYPMDDPRYRNPSGVLRKQLELYANVRPVRSYDGIATRWEDVDLIIVRENTEGFYADRNMLDGPSEFRPDPDTVISMRLVTRRASTEVARVAFGLAARRRQHVTAAHKANVLRRGDGLFLEACASVAASFPEVTFDGRHADALALDLVLDPTRFDVIVTTNMFGDILSDEAAGLVGGLGLAPGLNVGSKHLVGQAVHGSAPDLAGRGVANPIAEILSGMLLLRQLAEIEGSGDLAAAADAVAEAVEILLAEQQVRTPDLGGTSTTNDVREALIELISAGRHVRR
jgi:3-isopropylmalate dehydrogenase